MIKYLILSLGLLFSGCAIEVVDANHVDETCHKHYLDGLCNYNGYYETCYELVCEEVEYVYYQVEIMTDKRCLIFNSKGEFWNWAHRHFQLAPIDVPLGYMELELAKRADNTADLVHFEKKDWDLVVSKCKEGKPFCITE